MFFTNNSDDNETNVDPDMVLVKIIGTGPDCDNQEYQTMWLVTKFLGCSENLKYMA